MNSTTFPDLKDNPENIKYEYRHNSSVLYMRDRALNREKQLWAKVQYSEISFKFVGTITVRGWAKGTESSPTKTIDMTVLIDSTDNYWTPLEKLNNLKDEFKKVDSHSEWEWTAGLPFCNTQLTINGSNSGYKKIQISMDNLLANYLGFKEVSFEYNYDKNFPKRMFISEYPPIEPNQTIFMYHPNLLGSNYNDDEISVMFHPHERQINYDLIYEVRSLNPTVKIEFFQYCLKYITYTDENGNPQTKIITVRRKVFPTNFNVIMGLYDGF